MRTAWTLAALAVSAVALSALPATAAAVPASPEAAPLDILCAVVPIIDGGPCHQPGGLFWP